MDTQHLTPELIRTVNKQRASQGKPMLSWDGFQAGCLKLDLNLATLPQEQAITQLTGYEIPSSLMSTYSSSYEVPKEAGQQAVSEQGSQAGQQQGKGEQGQHQAGDRT